MFWVLGVEFWVTEGRPGHILILTHLFHFYEQMLIMSIILELLKS